MPQSLWLILRFPLILLIGWTTGTVINYLCDVLPLTRKLSAAFCHNCGKKILPLHFIFLKPCTSCRKPRSLRSWIVMIMMIVLAVFLEVYSLGRMGFWLGYLVIAYFMLVAVIDFENRIIMHPVSIFGALMGFSIGTWLHGWKATLIGGTFGMVIMLIVYFFGIYFARWLTKMKNKGTFEAEEALGFGDVALSAVLGLFLGWPGITGGLLLAILLGGIGSLMVLIFSLIFKRYHALMSIPYGPFLLLGAAILLFRPGV